MADESTRLAGLKVSRVLGFLQEAPGKFYRYVHIDGLSPQEYKESKLVNPNVDFVEVGFDEGLTNYALRNRGIEWTSLDSRGVAPIENHSRRLANVASGLSTPMNMGYRSGGLVGHVHNGVIHSYGLFGPKESAYSGEPCFGTHPLKFADKILKSLEEANFEDIGLSILLNDVPVNNVHSWNVPKKKLLLTGEYEIKSD